MTHDLRYGLRSLVRQPGFALAAILTIAIGIGANTTIFSLVNGILLQPLPYKEADRLVAVWPASWHSKPVFEQLQEDATSFEALAGWAPRSHILTGEAGADRLWGPRATTGFFEVLQPDVTLGRTFSEGDDKHGTAVAVISHGLWQRRYGGDPGVVGRTLRLSGTDRTVVGVMSRSFDFLQQDAEVAVPQLMEEDAPGYGYKELKLIGRLRAGVSVEEADAELRAIVSRWRQEYGLADDWGVDAGIIPLREHLVGDVAPTFLLLFGAVGLTLLIATANVATLLLARALSRQREISLRLALGARPFRLARQLLTESTLIGILGGLVGVGGAIFGLSAVVAMLPPEIPRVQNVQVDGTVLGFSLLLSLFTGWIVGLVPALQATRMNLVQGLASVGRGLTGDRVQQRMRAGIVMVEVALAVMLLSGSGLMIKSLGRLMQVNPGFQAEGLLVFDVIPDGNKMTSPAERESYYQQLDEQLAAIPGVLSTAMINVNPLSPDGAITGTYPTDQPPEDGDKPPVARWRPVTPGYFHTARIPLLAGRLFEGGAGDEQVAVISQRAAGRLFPAGDALGSSIMIGMEKDNPVVIIGIVGDVKALGLDQESPLIIYRPFSQVGTALDRFNMTSRSVMLRAAGEPHTLTGQAREAVLSLDRQALIDDLRTMPAAISDSMGWRRVTTILLSLFTATSLILGAVGVYGVMWYAVRVRSREIGIRVALGASSGMVLREVLRHGLRIAGTGTALGLLLSLALSRWLESFVFGISTTDPWVLATAAGLSIAVAIISSYVPARRASRANPMDSLSVD